MWPHNSTHTDSKWDAVSTTTEVVFSAAESNHDSYRCRNCSHPACLFWSMSCHRPPDKPTFFTFPPLSLPFAFLAFHSFLPFLRPVSILIRFHSTLPFSNLFTPFPPSPSPVYFPPPSFSWQLAVVRSKPTSTCWRVSKLVTYLKAGSSSRHVRGSELSGRLLVHSFMHIHRRLTISVVRRYGEIFLLRHRFLGEYFWQMMIVLEHQVCCTHAWFTPLVWHRLKLTMNAKYYYVPFSLLLARPHIV